MANTRTKRTSKRSNGTGTIYRRATGAAWTARWYDHNGQRQTRSTGTTDKGAAERILRKWVADAALRREGVVDARTDNYASADRRPIAEHLDDYRDDLRHRGRTPGHVVGTHAIALRVIGFAGIDRLSNLTAERVARGLARLDADGFSQRTREKALRAIKAFSRWAVQTHRIGSDPLAGMRGVTITERRVSRRALSPDEAARLIQSAERGGDIYGLSGPDRAILYAIALGTGFRVGELASLTPAAFALDDDQPTITIRAAYSKRRRADTQPIHPDLARWLRAWMAERPVDAPLWRLNRNMGAMVRLDLEAARRAWVAEAANPGERAARERDAGYLRGVDPAGRRVDFHGLRHSFITWVVESGASVRTAMELARHSTPVLTIGRYSHVRLADLRSALPSPPATTPREREHARALATGTDDARPERGESGPVGARQPCSQPRAQRGRETAPTGANTRNDRTPDNALPFDSGDAPNPLPFAELCGSTRTRAGGERGSTRPGGACSLPGLTVRPAVLQGPENKAVTAMSDESATTACTTGAATDTTRAHANPRDADDLDRIAAAWPDLPEPIRRAVLALIDAGGNG